MMQWKSKKFVLRLVLVATLVALCVWITRQISIDSCIDRGGRWDDSAVACDGASE